MRPIFVLGLLSAALLSSGGLSQPPAKFGKAPVSGNAVIRARAGKSEIVITTTLSNQLVRKRVRIGHGKFAQVLDCEVTFTLPPDEKHNFAQFEALTGYMPAELRNFWMFDAGAGKLLPLSDGPGEQAHPVVL